MDFTVTKTIKIYVKISVHAEINMNEKNVRNTT